MIYLLDTNALSEADKPCPDQEFMKWFNLADVSELYVSCLTVGELYKGIGLQKDTSKRQKLAHNTERILAAFENRILPIDQAAAKLWARLVVDATKKGRSAPVIDSLIAAQCLQHQMVIVTRNVRDFEQFTGVEVLCPWTST